MRRLTTLLAAAAAAAALATPAVAQAAPPGTLLALGRNLYVASCVSCHGTSGQGVQPVGSRRGAGGIRGAGPPLRGVGAAAADFYLRIGYMPLRRATDEPRRSRPSFDRHELDALVAYVASLGGGPAVPRLHPERGSLSEGLRLFTENCAGCHQVAGAGGLVVGGVAPALGAATPTQIAEAVRIGPYLMPAFSRRQLDDRQLDSIVRYVKLTQEPVDRGGWGIGHLGPVPEGLVAWLLAGSALLVVTRLIGERLR